MAARLSSFSWVALISFVQVAVAQDGNVPHWPQFRGPNASGVAVEGSYPAALDPEENLVWKVELPHGVSSPCIWGDRIFLTAFTPETSALETLCLDRASGDILWRRAAPADQIERVHDISSPANATPATDGQRVYVYFASFGLLCYDFDGGEIWKKPLPCKESRFGSGTSPIVAGGLVVLNRDEPGFNAFGVGGGGEIVAVDSSTGEIAWHTPRPPTAVMYSTPVLWQGGDQPQVLLVGSGRLTAYDLTSGEEAWWFEGLPPQVAATPQIAGEHVYLTGTGMFGETEAFLGLPSFAEMVQQHDANDDGELALEEITDLLVVDRRASGGVGNSPLAHFNQGLDANKDGRVDQSEWQKLVEGVSNFMASQEPGLFAVRLDGAGDVSRTHLEWRETKGVAEVPSPLLYRDRLYVVRNGGIVHCRDAEDGSELYTERLEAVGGYYASPVAGDGKAYFAADTGVVTVIAAGDEFEVLSQTDLGDRIMATPALAVGAVYVRTDRHLYAFGPR